MGLGSVGRVRVRVSGRVGARVRVVHEDRVRGRVGARVRVVHEDRVRGRVGARVRVVHERTGLLGGRTSIRVRGRVGTGPLLGLEVGLGLGLEVGLGLGFESC